MKAYAGVIGACDGDFVATSCDDAERFSEGRDWEHSAFQAFERICFGVYHPYEDVNRWVL